MKSVAGLGKTLDLVCFNETSLISNPVEFILIKVPFPPIKYPVLAFEKLKEDRGEHGKVSIGAQLEPASEV